MTGSGVDVRLRHSPTPEKHQIETMTGGVCAFDYDRDGAPDLYFVNGARQPELTKSDPSYWNRLYRNRGGWRFEDVTAKAGVQGEGYGMGCATADFNNDGLADLFVAGVNRNLLYRNRGDGTFEDVTRAAGLDEPGEKPWSIAAGWLDYDNDGWLDLFVVNYVRWDPAREPYCGHPAVGLRTYCHPKFYEGLPNRLYRNLGNGSFRDVSAETGVAAHRGKGMGIAVADCDADGRLDVFVANDTEPDFLFHNEGGRFREIGMQVGVALNEDGRALSSMGVDFRDFDNDSLPDLFVTALANETFPLYRNLGNRLFAGVTYRRGVGAATLSSSGWGNGIFDFDNDGRKDLFAAAGDVNDNTELYSNRRSRQPNLLLFQTPEGNFRPVSIGPAALHRGAAFADFDLDGAIDVVCTRLGQTPVLYRNMAGKGRRWLMLHLEGTKSNRDAIGARIRLVGRSGHTQYNHVTTSVGYASSSPPLVHFGLGGDEAARMEIHWPSGAFQIIENPGADRYLRVREPAAAAAR